MFELLITARSFGYANKKALQAFRDLSGLNFTKPEHKKAYSEDEMCELVPGYDAVIVGTDKVTAKVIQHADRLKIISKHGVGVDNIDLKAASEAGIIVTNLPGLNDLTVADLAMGLILATSRKICFGYHNFRNGVFDKFLSHEVWGKTLGVIGTGRIGQAVIRRALAFDMKVVAYDVYPDHNLAGELGFAYVPLESLIQQSDFISLHVPRTQETVGLLGKKQFEKMKPSAIVVNTSRGGIINEKELMKALHEKKIAGAALDVFDHKILRDPSIQDLDNLILLPHVAAYTYETLEAMDMKLVEIYQDFLNGVLPVNIAK